MIGGMIWPPVDATASTPAANGALKPVRFISGMVMAPVTITLATALPDTVPNSDEEMTATLPGPPAERPVSARAKRSEEHTSDLQSLMRISYAVFCLKKKKKNTQI